MMTARPRLGVGDHESCSDVGPTGYLIVITVVGGEPLIICAIFHFTKK